jgi:H+/Cl- antiporter ClcA
MQPSSIFYEHIRDVFHSQKCVNAFRVVCCLVLAGLLLGLNFDPRGGGSAFLHNVDKLLPDYMVLHLFIISAIRTSTF